MAYNLRNSGGLRGGTHGGLRETEDVNPMANVANIVDAMLVMSLGLMVALIAFWQLDTSQLQEMVEGNEMTNVDVNKMAEEMQNNSSSYEELGTVYQDPSTGQLYMLTKDVDKGASNVSDDSGSSSKSSKSK